MIYSQNKTTKCLPSFLLISLLAQEAMAMNHIVNRFSIGDRVTVTHPSWKNSCPGIVKAQTVAGYTVARLSGKRKGEPYKESISTWFGICQKEREEPIQFSDEMLSPLAGVLVTGADPQVNGWYTRKQHAEGPPEWWLHNRDFWINGQCSRWFDAGELNPHATKLACDASGDCGWVQPVVGQWYYEKESDDDVLYGEAVPTNGCFIILVPPRTGYRNRTNQWKIHAPVGPRDANYILTTNMFKRRWYNKKIKLSGNKPDYRQSNHQHAAFLQHKYYCNVDVPTNPHRGPPAQGWRTLKWTWRDGQPYPPIRTERVPTLQVFA